MPLRILSEPEIRTLVTPHEADRACRDAFMLLQLDQVVQPDVMHFDFPAHHGDAHGKGAYLLGTPYFSIKLASGFYDNASRGLPVMGGCVMVFDATTGQACALLLDNGFLTDLRTGAAGGIAADVLARTHVGKVAVLGAGGQARFQLAALLAVRQPSLVAVWSRSFASAQACAVEMESRHDTPVVAMADGEEACRDADIIVTVTPARSPILNDRWVRPGAHVTAVGSDTPAKQEVESALLRRATVVADRLSQCVTQGEIHHALAEGLMRAEDVHAELGDILLGRRPGRTRDDEITLADLTGVGALDAAMANLVVARALALNVGRTIET